MFPQRVLLIFALTILTLVPFYFYLTATNYDVLLVRDHYLDNARDDGQNNLTTLYDKYKLSGYLVGSTTSAIPQLVYYRDTVDLRIIVLTYNRSNSLLKCLQSLNKVDYLNSSVSLHIWIDRSPIDNRIDQSTDNVSKQFVFLHGPSTVHHHRGHVGILGQWVNTWRPHPNSTEQAVFLEDDISVSPHFWRWLRLAHKRYDVRNDVSGYGLSHPGISHAQGDSLFVPSNTSVFLYRVICTWGYSPHPHSWRQFQEWFYTTGRSPQFVPFVPGILPTQWFLGEKKRGTETSLWEMWHIYYTHNSEPPQFSVILNSQYEGLLAVNRHELGLHDQGKRSEPWEFLLTNWNDKYIDFPLYPDRYNYDGNVIENNNYTYQYGT